MLAVARRQPDVPGSCAPGWGQPVEGGVRTSRSRGQTPLRRRSAARYVSPARRDSQPAARKLSSLSGRAERRRFIRALCCVRRCSRQQPFPQVCGIPDLGPTVGRAAARTFPHLLGFPDQLRPRRASRPPGATSQVAIPKQMRRRAPREASMARAPSGTRGTTAPTAPLVPCASWLGMSCGWLRKLLENRGQLHCGGALRAGMFFLPGGATIQKTGQAGLLAGSEVRTVPLGVLLSPAQPRLSRPAARVKARADIAQR